MRLQDAYIEVKRIPCNRQYAGWNIKYLRQALMQRRIKEKVTKHRPTDLVHEQYVLKSVQIC